MSYLTEIRGLLRTASVYIQPSVEGVEALQHTVVIEVNVLLDKGRIQLVGKLHFTENAKGGSGPPGAILWATLQRDIRLAFTTSTTL